MVWQSKMQGQLYSAAGHSHLSTSESAIGDLQRRVSQRKNATLIVVFQVLG